MLFLSQANLKVLPADALTKLLKERAKISTLSED